MKTEWDYTNLADAYLKRPDYSETAIDAMLSIAGLAANSRICDIGAGVAHLTIPLASRGFLVDAVEPNDSMRRNGIERTIKESKVIWHEGTGEDTGMAGESYHMTTFGSSFNVCNRQKALIESKRILVNRGWFACMWNHRDLGDPLQKEIESIIQKRIPDYGYGTRREDQRKEIEKSGLFDNVLHLNAVIQHSQTIEECSIAWKSHATLERQAKNQFNLITNEIDSFLDSLGNSSIKIPYLTNIWLAQLK